MFVSLGHRILRWLQRQSVRYYMARMNVGCRVSIKRGLVVHRPGNITLGDDVRINADVVLQAHAPIRIGASTMIAARCVIVTANHDLSKRRLEAFEGIEPAAVAIGHDCWLGAGVVVLPGVTIGDGVVVGAGSVVTRDLPPATICAGVPARPMRSRPSGEGEAKCAGH